MVVKSIINSEKLSLQNAELWLNLVGVLGVFFEFRKRKSSHKAKLGLATGYSGFKFQLAWRLFLLTSGNWANVFLQPWWWICPDWLMMIAYIALFSALLSRLTVLVCGSAWVTSFYSAFFEYPPKWCTYSAGMAGATWNCSRLGASSVYTIQPCTMSLHAKPHT